MTKELPKDDVFSAKKEKKPVKVENEAEIEREKRLTIEAKVKAIRDLKELGLSMDEIKKYLGL